MQEKIKKWKEIARESVFEKFGRGVDKVKYELQSGKLSEYYIKREKPTVAVLAITKNQEIVLARQFRPGPQKIFNELPGGLVEDGEDVCKSGERELLEETGFAGDAVLVGRTFNCGYSTVEKNCVVVTNCEKITKQNLDDTEFVKIVLTPLKEFREVIRKGEMTDLHVAYMGLDYLKLL